MHTRAVPTQLDNSDLARSFGFGYFFDLLLSKAWLIMLFSVFCLLAAVIYLQLTPKLYESRSVLEVESKSGQAKLTRLQSTLEAELLERQANLTKAQGDRDSAVAEMQADERLAQRGLISALDFDRESKPQSAMEPGSSMSVLRIPIRSEQHSLLKQSPKLS